MKFGSYPPTIELFFIGDNFYLKSGTEMSSIYITGTHERFDWGFVKVALEEGKNIFIRPATKDEMNWANSKLINLLK